MLSCVGASFLQGLISAEVDLCAVRCFVRPIEVACIAAGLGSDREPGPDQMSER